MKSISKLRGCMFAAALLVVGGLSSAAHSAPAKPASTDTGAVAMTVTMTPSTLIEIEGKRTDAKGKFKIKAHSFKGPFKLESAPSPEVTNKDGIYLPTGSQTRTYIAYQTLPAGKYTISRLNIDERFYGYKWASVEDIPFEVTAGKTTYLGDFQWQLMWGVSRIKFEYPQGWRFFISNEEERDTKWIKEDHPEAGEVVVSVPTTWNRNPWF